MKLGVIFGGNSSEHDISIVSATNIIENLNKNKYNIFPIYISKDNIFYKYDIDINKIKSFTLNDKLTNLVKIDNIIDYLKNMDVVFPILHGKNGEDGTIQGMLELFNIPYVGCGVLASSICMDKVYTKYILNKANIKQAKSMYIKKYNDKYIYIDDEFNRYILSIEELFDEVDYKLKFPVFIKPSRSGSSIGVHKANKNDFKKFLEDAFKYDSKILIEEAIIGREVECAVLGNDDLIASSIGEIISHDKEFYSFDSKYKDNLSFTKIVEDTEKEIIEEIKNIAKKAYYACDCSGLARVDFFIENDTNRIILNEINTIPGFTKISMYPILMNDIGISYSDLLDKLINLALECK